MSELVKVRFAYDYSKPNRNKRIYSKQCMEDAFNEAGFKELQEHNAVPIMSDDFNILGVCRLELSDTKVYGEGIITNPTFAKYISENPDNFAITSAGTGDLSWDANNNIAHVNNYCITTCQIMDRSKCAFDCNRLELVDEDYED